MNATDIKALKAQVRARDGYCCKDCGLSNADHIAATGRSLDVHRLDPGAPYVAERCETLCITCHSTKPKSPRVRKARQPFARIELVSPTNWIQELDEVAAAMGMGRSAYIRSACSIKMATDNATPKQPD